MKKNEIVSCEFIDIDDMGQGIGKVDGIPIFVKSALPGDRGEVVITKVQKGYCFGKLLELSEKSPYRVEPACEMYTQCGGCQLQALDYDTQISYKEKRVRDCIERIGGIKNPPIEPIIPSDNILRYRNKAQYPVGMDKKGRYTTGFFAVRSHRIVPCGDCVICPAEFKEISGAILSWMEENHISSYEEQKGTGVIRHIFLRKAEGTGEIGLCLVINSDNLPGVRELMGALEKFSQIVSVTVSVNKKNTNVILGDECKTIWGRDFIYDFIGDVKFKISPQSFYQVNPGQTKRLYDTVKEYADPKENESILDLYCGIGTISLYLAKYVKDVIGVEVVEKAIENAVENARINNLTNARFYTGDAGAVLERLKGNEKKETDTVIVDPPRKGCDYRTLSLIKKLSPKKIIYVSCNPATLARDLKVLTEDKYRVERVRPVDMFPQTVHVETVVQMIRKNPETYLDVKIDLDELDVTPAETAATYQEIRDYILKEHGVKVSSLYIAQVKEKQGLKERENYNKAQNKSAKQPQCPKEKEELIVGALKHFQMI